MSQDDAQGKDPDDRRGAVRNRLIVATCASVALLASAVVAFPSYGGTSATSAGGNYAKAYDVAGQTAAALKRGQDTVNFPDGTHLHLNAGKLTRDGHLKVDPEAKNAVSRGARTVDSDTVDPTTPTQAHRAERAVAAQRAAADPALSKAYVRRGHAAVPRDRYEMAGGCYAIRSTKNAKWLRMAGTTPTFAANRRSGGLPVFFKATDLGSYLLHALDHQDLGKTLLGLGFVATPGDDASWTVREVRPGAFTFTLPNKQSLTTDASGKATLGSTPGRFTMHLTTHCTAFPEITTNVTGKPFSGTSSFQEVRGYVDAHTHGMAFEFLGGDAHCGRPWDEFGVAEALKDCPDHYYTNGKGAVLEAFLSGKPTHDPVGWPTFKDWPAPDSLTHEGTYYKWLERSWRGGERLFVNLLVENDQLCKLYPIKHNSCDDMDSIRLQAKDMRELERYVDAQSGGPGWGWYRIVESPAQARAVINKGKLAVVMGIETSVPFGCTMKLNVPQCDKASIDRQLDEVHKLGVRQMELVNKFDNALSGVAGDEGATGNLVNAANFLETGSFWQMEHCANQDPEVHDRDQTTTPANPAQDAIFGAIFKLDGPTLPVPLYPSPHHCNVKGLTALGASTIRGMAKRHMIFDPDHMSVKARKSSLDLIDALKYPGVVSSHSWSTPDAYARIYREGGFITPYAGDSTGFVAKWKRHLTWADPRYYFGIGFGADINGLGAQGDPRPGAATNKPVTYPFKGLGGVTIHKQVSGRRVYDINKDGVAHYGLYSDWIADLRHLGGNAIVKDMSRGPEAYLQMWERAEGVRPNACVNEGRRKRVSFFTGLAKGSTTWSVLTRAGQPAQRRGTSYTYCAGTKASPARVRVSFTPAGRLTKVARIS